MFHVVKIKNSYFVGTDSEIRFRNKQSIIKKLNEFLNEIYSKCGEIIKPDNNIFEGFAYQITSQDDIITDSLGKVRNYKIYNIEVAEAVFTNKDDAIKYLEGLINDIILHLNDVEANNGDFEEDILDIIK